jgi:glycosyltransferase involved in cell wall biosynthesis
MGETRANVSEPGLSAAEGHGVVVIPAYNEAANIADVIAGVRTQLPHATILVVDDCSPDHTAVIARRSGAIVLSLPINLGDGAARQTGFKYADCLNADWIVHLDGDGQHCPESIPALLAPILADHADLVIGSRFLGESGYCAQASRRIGMRLFGAVASWAIGRMITDPTSGFRAMNRRAYRFFCGHAYPQQYPDADVLIAAYRAGLRLVEVPVQMRPSTTGQTIHAGLRPLYYVYKMALSIFVTMFRGDKA